MDYITNPVKAIRAKCKDCCAGQLSEIEHCPIPDCPLYPFRKGKNPFRTKKDLTEEEKQKIIVRLNKAKAKREKELEDEENSL